MDISSQTVQIPATQQQKTFIGKWKFYLYSLVVLSIIIIVSNIFLKFLILFDPSSLSLMGVYIYALVNRVLVSLILLIVILITVDYFFTKNKQQKSMIVLTETKWKLAFFSLGVLYLLLSLTLVGESVKNTLLLPAIYFGKFGLPLSVITFVCLFVYFDNHKPRKVFETVGKIILYVSLGVFLYLGILSVLGWLIG